MALIFGPQYFQPWGGTGEENTIILHNLQNCIWFTDIDRLLLFSSLLNVSLAQRSHLKLDFRILPQLIIESLLNHGLSDIRQIIRPTLGILYIMYYFVVWAIYRTKRVAPRPLTGIDIFQETLLLRCRVWLRDTFR